MASFWLDWALWIKLVFLLGCGIFVTIGAGLVKVLVVRHRLGRSLVLQENRGGQTLAEKREEEEISPFGAVALEQGIVIDGVWTSTSNTPKTSTERLPRSATRDLEGRPLAPTVRRSTQARPSLPYHQARTVVSEAVPEDMGTVSALGGSYSLFALRHPDYAKAMHEIEADYQAEIRLDAEAAAVATRREQHALKHSSEQSRYLTRNSSDLSMLDRQRLSQAAETGQILRSRRSSR